MLLLLVLAASVCKQVPSRRGLLAPSKQQSLIIGLNLLRLLVQNRIAEFHTELELIPDEVESG